MHDYYIKKQITLKRKNPFEIVVNLFILLTAIPVIAIAAISLLLYFFFMRIIALLNRSKSAEIINERYHYEMELLNNEHVKIMIEEDELDTELSHLNDLWMEKVYNRETCLYRARTFPLIEELEGKILCFFLKEKTEGAFLQVLNNGDFDANLPDTRLVFLHYHTLKVTVIDNTGKFYLYNDEKNAEVIVGFNNKEKILIEIAHT